MIKWLDLGIKFTVGGLMLLMTVIVLAQVFFRAFLNISLSWSTEISTFMFSWIVFLGASIGFKKGSHFCVDLLVNQLPPKLRRVADWIARLIVTVFLGVLIWYGIELVYSVLGQVSPAMEAPMALMYVVVPLGSLIMLIYLWQPVQEGGEK